jgi:hypothetical protein
LRRAGQANAGSVQKNGSISGPGCRDELGRLDHSLARQASGFVMKDAARLIIPAWGEVYASRLVSVTLPAVLAPGNLPALSGMFDMEVVIVTESRLFEPIRNSPSFQEAAKICAARLVTLDDLMTDIPGDYGVVLTYALFRGFADLGELMTRTYLLFLNADFIVADGSLAHLGKLMAEGHRVIHAPSFRVVLEEVWPQLQARVDPATCTLRLAPREMVALALAHKHPTVMARTVNQRLFHQTWMDQYYWYVDEDTLIGHQIPVALVAIKPERVLSEPVLVWDYGFIPEAAPTAQRYFIGDSDDFFMIEPQRRDTGREMIRPGWISFDEIAKNLSMWTTKEQRECGRQLLKIHASDLPNNLDEVVDESDRYMAQIYRRLSATALPHIGHSYLGGWFEGAKQRMRRRGAPDLNLPPDDAQVTAPATAPKSAAPARFALRVMETIYRHTFGLPPHVSRFHPLWIDTAPIIEKITKWRKSGKQNILWLSSSDSLLHRLLERRVEPGVLLADIRGSLFGAAPYDACICELTVNELANFDRLYAELRPLMQEGGEVVVSVQRSGVGFERGEFGANLTGFPGIDISNIRFFGTVASGFLRELYVRASSSFPNRPVARGFVTSLILILLAPLVRIVNARASRRATFVFSANWTSLMIEFTVKRGQSAAARRSRVRASGEPAMR